MTGRPSGNVLVTGVRDTHDRSGPREHSRIYSLDLWRKTATREQSVYPFGNPKSLIRMHGECVFSVDSNGSRVVDYLCVFNGVAWNALSTTPIEPRFGNYTRATWHAKSSQMAFVMGDQFDGTNAFSYDPHSDRWSHIVPPFDSLDTLSIDVEEHNGSVICVHEFKFVKSYDHREDEWHDLKAIEQPLDASSCRSFSVTPFDDQSLLCYYGRNCSRYDANADRWEAKPEWRWKATRTQPLHFTSTFPRAT